MSNIAKKPKDFPKVLFQLKPSKPKGRMFVKIMFSDEYLHSSENPDIAFHSCIYVKSY